MNMRLARVLSALAVGGAAISFASAAQAVTVQFASTVTFTNSVSNLTFASSGLNSTLTVGVPQTINQFISVTVGSGIWGASNSSITANFTFTVPTPTGTTTDSGAITGGQMNGSSRLGSLSIVWPNQPVEFDFADGTKLDVTLGNLSTTCTGNNCLADNPAFMSGTFLVLNGPTTSPEFAGSETPIPAALPLLASGLSGFGLLAWRRKRKNVAARAAV